MAEPARVTSRERGIFPASTELGLSWRLVSKKRGICLEKLHRATFWRCENCTMSKGKRAAKRRLDENMGFECILLYLVDGFNPSAKYQSVVSWDDYYKYMEK